MLPREKRSASPKYRLIRLDDVAFRREVLDRSQQVLTIRRRTQQVVGLIRRRLAQIRRDKTQQLGLVGSRQPGHGPSSFPL